MTKRVRLILGSGDAHEFWKARALIYAGHHWTADALNRQTLWQN